jgi:WD40 repeat protein
VAFSPSGRELIASGKDRSAAVWDLETGENIKTLKGPGFALDLDVSSDGGLIAMTGHLNKATVRDRATGEEVFTAQPGGDAGNLDWNPDGQLPAIPAYEEGQAIIVDRSGQEVAVLSDAVGVADVEFSPDGRLLATAGLPAEERPNGPAPRVKIWDWEKGETGTQIPVVAGGMAFDPSGRRIALSNGGLAEIWDADTGQKLGTFAGHEGDVWDVAFSPEGSVLATAGHRPHCAALGCGHRSPTVGIARTRAHSGQGRLQAAMVPSWRRGRWTRRPESGRSTWTI